MLPRNPHRNLSNRRGNRWFSKNGTGLGGGNGNSPSDDFFRLQTVVTGYNSVPGALAPLPTPVLTGDNTSGTANDSFALGGLATYDYAVLHYGAGPGGTSGGGVEVYYLDGASSFTFPANGTGPNGNGGFSSIVLYGPDPQGTVPDGGATVGLLGLGLTGLSLIRRKMK